MEQKKLQINALSLHVFGMLCMLLDHMWATVIPGNMWMTYVGRLAFPIFSFMAVEGYFHTGNFKKYMQRLLIFALASEIPFNMMNTGTWIDPFHQNVIWTFLIALLCVRWMEHVRQKEHTGIIKLCACAGIGLLGYLVGTVTMVDYHGAGVLTVLVFYFFHGRNWQNLLGQLAGLYFINFFVLRNLEIPISAFGHTLFFPAQGFALLALIPIWLYRGKQGPHNKAIQYACYAFYPVHILVLSLIARIL